MSNIVSLPLDAKVVTFDNPLKEIFPDVTTGIVATPASSVAILRQFWRLVDTLYGGTEGMRLAGETYLPRQIEESDENYERRLKRSTLHNYYKSSISSAVGKVFTRDVRLEQPSTEVQLIALDVDAQGRNLSQFSRAVFDDAINHGVSFILVDHTRTPLDYTNQALQSSESRPYWVHVPATKVLDARAVDFAGTQRLGYFRYEEEVFEPTSDGFSGANYHQIRVFKQDPGTPVYFAVYRATSSRADLTASLPFNPFAGITTAGGSYVLIDAGILVGVDAIPVVPIYTNRTGFFMGKPPLQDLADVNVAHWQCNSDYQNSVHVATIPFLLTKGLKQELDESGNPAKLKVSVNAGIVATDPNAHVEWIETKGEALEAARRNIDALCNEMEKLGNTLCASTPGGISATEKSINASEAQSIIKSWALSLQDGLNGALYFTSQYLGGVEPGLAKVNVDYSIDYAGESTMPYIIDAYKLGAISAETVIAEGKRRNVFDPEAAIAAPGFKPPEAAVQPATEVSVTPDTPIRATPLG